jgi:membrane associated rhomboid family serine protease
VLHLLGNMVFLWIFGDNVEDRFGRVRFVVFYLACGLVAGGAHLLSAPDSRVPTIGASGAISGVMGAYLVLYPHARVQMLVVLGFFIDLVVLPAPYFLGYWFLLQLLSATVENGQGGGVAWWAHIGGFAAGVVVAGVMRAGGWLRDGGEPVALRRGRFRSARWQR